MAQYRFLANGRYEFGIGTVTTMGLLERTSSSVSDGRYELRGGELTVTPDRRDRGVSKYRVRIYDEFVRERWTRAMSLLDENAKPALEVQYMRIRGFPLTDVLCQWPSNNEAEPDAQTAGPCSLFGRRVRASVGRFF